MVEFNDLSLENVQDGPLGVAVSGGGDSVALLCLLTDWARAKDRVLHVATVNHHLREEAGAEAALVAQLCDRLGWDHSVLDWADWDGQGNLQNAARLARIALLGAWAQGRGLTQIATGHTMDDQAETFLTRLARGSGVDGLSGMARTELRDGIAWHRPMLGLRREALRDFLRSRGIEWAEDASNQDERFDRIKIRNRLDHLADIGLSVERLASTAQTLQTSRAALEQATFELAEIVAQPTKVGSVLVDCEILRNAPLEIQRRLLAHSLGWVSGAVYRPRLTALDKALIAILMGESRTLHGCCLIAKKGRAEICREVFAIRSSTPFDGRWQTDHGAVRPLGPDGLRQVPDWRASGFSRPSLEATPSYWQNDQLIGAPLLDFGTGHAELIGGVQSFFTSIKSH